MVAFSHPTSVRRPADSELSERGLHNRRRQELGNMQRELRRLDRKVAAQDIRTGRNHDDDPIDYSTERGVRFWPEHREVDFAWQGDEPVSRRHYPSAETFRQAMRRVEVEVRKLPASRRAGAVAARKSH